MTGEFMAFTVLGAIAILGALFMLQLSKVVHMVVALVFTFLSLAGLYVLLSAEFVAAVQVLIYAGAITVIMLFGIMLTKHQDEETSSNRLKKFIVFLLIIGFAISFYIGIYQLDFHQEGTDLHVNNTKQIGNLLYTRYIIPFELTSVILLVALVGAIILAKKDEEKEEKP
ncbi:NADH-quinone oxidoreductase subunit J [Bacillus sp. FJAT-47783]|uniref:NADH-quinone oxidoreductase subunit J n=1 Tax=Bacillus sp. FJAT-47783 TaxID=2922712 RepID=UPI001FABC6D1|nr:NADH-quinone oxidoreductase subunit J [Bacillus sp. FJAT-47783]